MKSYFKSLSAEQPDVRFFGLRLVKFVSAIFGSVFLFTLAVTLFDTSALNWKLDVEGLKFFFLDAMKVPGSILAFYLAVLGLIGANHRSEQTKKQIASATLQLASSERQNLFNNYFKHLEEFTKHVTRNLNHGEVNTSALRHGHDYLYPNSLSKGDFSLNVSAIEGIEVFLIKAIKFLESVEDKKELTRGLDLLEEITDFQSQFSINPPLIGEIVNQAKTPDERHIDVVAAYDGTARCFISQIKVLGFSTDVEWQSDAKRKASHLHRQVVRIRNNVLTKKTN